jgi:hypothetical protein
MTYRYSTTVNNAKLEAIETAIPNPKFQIWTGTEPAIGGAATGSKLLEIVLPSNWMETAAAGVKAILAAKWSGQATGTGLAGYFRITQTDGTTAGIQGAIGAGLDMTLDNYTINSGQTVTVNSFTITAANT